MPVVTAVKALGRLREGNQRYVSGAVASPRRLDHSQRKSLAKQQSPFAIILGCSDSRVPAEMVFDQGLGDLFVIRVAGNIVAPSQIGSIEFAAEQFGTRLVVVMGHSQCGAVIASLEQLEQPTHMRSPNLGFIVKSIQPCVEPLLESESSDDRGALVSAAVRANIRASVDQLRHGSDILESLADEKGLLIVGAEYSLETGVVDFFDD
jgi:carbonic anhydrase